MLVLEAFIKCIITYTLLLPFTSADVSTASFEEKLNLKLLPKDYVLSSFNFKLKSDNIISSSNALFEFKRHNGFSRSIEPLLTKNNVKNLYIKFTKGHWDSQKWGKLPNNGWSSGGSGVEIWAMMEASNKDEVIKNWNILMSEVSGLFCSSVNFINSEKITFINDIQSYYDVDLLDHIPITNEDNELFFLRGSLANEAVCTENLSPFLRILPTNGKTGLSSLINGNRLFDSYWNSMSIDINTVCTDESNCYLDTEIDINFVVNIPQALARKERPTPKPVPAEELQCDPSKKLTDWECFPLLSEKTYSFFLSDIFGTYINDSNRFNKEQVSSISITGIDDEHWSTGIKVIPRGVEDKEEIERLGLLGTSNHVYELKEHQKTNYDIYIGTTDNTKVALDESEYPPIYVTRSLTGDSQDKGVMRVAFTNPSQQREITIRYFETLPWFIRLYVSSLKINVKPYKNLNIPKFSGDAKDVILKTDVKPSIIRSAPLHMQHTLRIPKNSVVMMTFDFEKPLLNYEEYPPDSNHGFEVEAAVVVVIDESYEEKALNGEFKGHLKDHNYIMRTSTLLLTLATPDFSMPYNVITITSTLMAFSFGLIFNLLTKRVVTFEDSKKLVTERPLVRLLKGLKLKK